MPCLLLVLFEKDLNWLPSTHISSSRNWSQCSVLQNFSTSPHYEHLSSRDHTSIFSLVCFFLRFFHFASYIFVVRNTWSLVAPKRCSNTALRFTYQRSRSFLRCIFHLVHYNLYNLFTVTSFLCLSSCFHCFLLHIVGTLPEFYLSR